MPESPLWLALEVSLTCVYDFQMNTHTANAGAFHLGMMDVNRHHWSDAQLAA